MIQNTIKSGDVISCKEAEAYFTINDQRFHAMNLTKLEATVEKDKAEVPLLGRRMRAHKSVGMIGKFSATMHWMSSRFQREIEKYKNGDADVYFMIQGTISDSTSATGTQTVILYSCNLDDTPLMAFDADGETLEMELQGTFDDFSIQNEFTELDGVL